MKTIKLNQDNENVKNLIELDVNVLKNFHLHYTDKYITKDELVSKLRDDERYYEAIIDKSVFTPNEYLDINSGISRYYTIVPNEVLYKALEGKYTSWIRYINCNIKNPENGFEHGSNDYWELHDRSLRNQELEFITKTRRSITPACEDNLIPSLYGLMYNIYYEPYVKDKKYRLAEVGIWDALSILLGNINDYYNYLYYHEHLNEIQNGTVDRKYNYRLGNLLCLYLGLYRPNKNIYNITNAAIDLLNLYKDNDEYICHDLFPIYVYNNPKKLFRYGSVNHNLALLAVYRDNSMINEIKDPQQDLISISNGDLSILDEYKNKRSLDLIRICENPKYIVNIEKPERRELNLAFYLDNRLLLEPKLKDKWLYKYYLSNPDLILEKGDLCDKYDLLYALTIKPELILELDTKYIENIDLTAYALIVKPELILKMDNPRKLYKALAIICKPGLFTRLNDYSEDMKFTLWIADSKLYHCLDLHCCSALYAQKCMSDEEIKYERFKNIDPYVLLTYFYVTRYKH